MKPFFSIVIPVLNEEKRLPNLLKDLSRQTYENFEVIIVDGKSEDKTVEQALEFQKKFSNLRIIESDRRNVAHQRNLGAKTVLGKWIIFMDADNCFPNYFLEGIKYKIIREKADVFTTWCSVDGVKVADRAITNYLNIAIEVAQLIEYPGALGAMIGITKRGFNKTEGFDSQKVPLEDGKFIRDAVAEGLNFEIFRDPRYVYSLRRFRRSGKLKTLQKYATLYLKRLSRISINQKIEYPMGGVGVFSLKEENTLFGNVQERLKKFAKKPKIRSRIRSILASLEDGI